MVYVACCPTNVARTLASLGQYIYAQDEESLYIHQFISSEAETFIGKNKIEVNMESGLLQNGKIALDVKAEVPMMLKIRIPWYAKTKICQINGEIRKPEEEKHYLLLDVPAGENKIELDFGVAPRWLTADDRVREDAGKAVLMKGPLVYCLEEIDNGNLLSQIYVEANAQVKEEAPNPVLAGKVPVLTYKGSRIKNAGSENSLYTEVQLKKEDTILKAIPYCLWNNRGGGEMLVWQKMKIS